MEKQKATRIEGTRYVKIGTGVFDTAPQDKNKLKTICECLWCGERFGANVAGQCAMYCKNCKTKAGREAVQQANEKRK